MLTIALAAAPHRPRPPTRCLRSQDLQRVDLFLHSADWAKLRAEFQIQHLLPRRLTLNGQTVRNSASARAGAARAAATSPACASTSTATPRRRRFLGLKSFVLDNVTQDASGVHETVAMAFYARLGIPAPREIHTRLYVNNEYAGLYVIVESVDKDMLARVFGAIGDDTQNDGYLLRIQVMDDWQFGYLGDGLDRYKLRFEPTTHESKSDEELYRPIETLVRLANNTPTDRVAAELGAAPRHPRGHPLHRRAGVPRPKPTASSAASASTTCICIVSRTQTCTR